MRYAPLALAALVATALPSIADAQRVSADIRIGSGPIDGRIHVGDRMEYPSRTVVVVAPRRYERPVYREMAVSRMHRGHGWWRNRGYREIRVWYDVDRDRYYDHGDRYRDGLREVVIYERDGRFYDDDRDRYSEYRSGEQYYNAHDDDRRYGRQQRDRDDDYRDRDHDHDRH